MSEITKEEARQMWESLRAALQAEADAAPTFDEAAREISWIEEQLPKLSECEDWDFWVFANYGSEVDRWSYWLHQIDQIPGPEGSQRDAVQEMWSTFTMWQTVMHSRMSAWFDEEARRA